MREKKRKEIEQKRKDEEEKKAKKEGNELKGQRQGEIRKDILRKYEAPRLIRLILDNILVENLNVNRINHEQLTSRKRSLPRKLEPIPNSTKNSKKRIALIVNGKVQEGAM